MQQLLDQLGIDWRLLLSQAVNFALLLLVLRVFVYKPLLEVLHKRRERIEEGLAKADEAEKRLLAIDEVGKEKMRAAETEAFAIIKKTETDAKALEARLLAEAQRKEREERASTAALLRAKEEESRRAIEKEAAAMVKAAMVKAVELSPDTIDDALVARAVKEAVKEARQGI